MYEYIRIFHLSSQMCDWISRFRYLEHSWQFESTSDQVLSVSANVYHVTGRWSINEFTTTRNQTTTNLLPGLTTVHVYRMWQGRFNVHRIHPQNISPITCFSKSTFKGTSVADEEACPGLIHNSTTCATCISTCHLLIPLSSFKTSLIFKKVVMYSPNLSTYPLLFTPPRSELSYMDPECHPCCERITVRRQV